MSMTVEDLLEWLESAKRQSEQSGQDIAEYDVVVQQWFGARVCLVEDGKVDHGTNEVKLWVT